MLARRKNLSKTSFLCSEPYVFVWPAYSESLSSAFDLRSSLSCSCRSSSEILERACSIFSSARGVASLVASPVLFAAAPVSFAAPATGATSLAFTFGCWGSASLALTVG